MGSKGALWWVPPVFTAPVPFDALLCTLFLPARAMTVLSLEGGFSRALMLFWQATSASQGGLDSCESSDQPSSGEHSARTWPGLGTPGSLGSEPQVPMILSSPPPRASPLQLGSPRCAGGIGGRGKDPGSRDVAPIHDAEYHTCDRHMHSLTREIGL